MTVIIPDNDNYLDDELELMWRFGQVCHITSGYHPDHVRCSAPATHVIYATDSVHDIRNGAPVCLPCGLSWMKGLNFGTSRFSTCCGSMAAHRDCPMSNISMVSL